MKLNDYEIEIIKAIQEDLPHSKNPFREIAVNLNISEDQLLEKIKNFKKKGIIRRFGAILYHQRAGVKENGMIVWNVDDNKVNEIGEKFASFKEVSHCYERPKFNGWNYNLYTMVHGKTKEEVKKIAQKLSEISGVKDYKILFSIKEFKKSSMKYFVEED